MTSETEIRSSRVDMPEEAIADHHSLTSDGWHG